MKMYRKKLEIYASIFSASVILFGVIVGKEINKYCKKIKKEKEINKKKLEDEIEYFEKELACFKDAYTDGNIASVTLCNNNLKTNENKSYMYDKLTSLKNEILSYSFEERVICRIKIENFDNLYRCLINLDDNALTAKLLSMHNEDIADKEAKDLVQKSINEKKEYEKEISKLKAQRQHELDLYAAKIELEKAKFETICKAMTSSPNKNIQSTLNIKTNISED